ncbi:hypothetical protein C162_19664 [Paenibacillus sp. FSL R7-269]|nr:hypothetical protein C162_19664 [Paenibacillus sp. FSL R7-269]
MYAVISIRVKMAVIYEVVNSIQTGCTGISTAVSFDKGFIKCKHSPPPACPFQFRESMLPGSHGVIQYFDYYMSSRSVLNLKYLSE